MVVADVLLRYRLEKPVCVGLVAEERHAKAHQQRRRDDGAKAAKDEPSTGAPGRPSRGTRTNHRSLSSPGEADGAGGELV